MLRLKITGRDLRQTLGRFFVVSGLMMARLEYWMFYRSRLLSPSAGVPGHAVLVAPITVSMFFGFQRISRSTLGADFSFVRYAVAAHFGRLAAPSPTAAEGAAARHAIANEALSRRQSAAARSGYGLRPDRRTRPISVVVAGSSALIAASRDSSRIPRACASRSGCKTQRRARR